jgi:low affinity Fe/Cu permease
MIERHQRTEPRTQNPQRYTNTKPIQPGQGKTKETNGNRRNGNKQNGSQPPGISEWFRKFAHKTSALVGSPWTFVAAFVIIVVWGLLGPVCKFSDTWQLVINTATTIITFLMVFLIQNTQNRDAKAIHLKLDELIHAVKGARNKLIDLENCSDEELKQIQEQFERLRKAHRASGEKPANSDEKS